MTTRIIQCDYKNLTLQWGEQGISLLKRVKFKTHSPPPVPSCGRSFTVAPTWALFNTEQSKQQKHDQPVTPTLGLSFLLFNSLRSNNQRYCVWRFVCYNETVHLDQTPLDERGKVPSAFAQCSGMTNRCGGHSKQARTDTWGRYAKPIQCTVSGHVPLSDLHICFSAMNANTTPTYNFVLGCSLPLFYPRTLSFLFHGVSSIVYFHIAFTPSRNMIICYFPNTAKVFNLSRGGCVKVNKDSGKKTL